MSVKIAKVFNNNVVLIEENHREKIIFGKGIGFGRKSGEIVDSGMKIEKVFVIEDSENNKNFKELINYTDSKVVGMCEEAIFMIQNELGEELDEKIHVSLTDHIAFTLKRLENNEEIHNPFLIETETLYRKESEIAFKVARFIEKTMKIEIPDGEAGFIALHIHSARNKGKLSNTMKYTFLINTIVEHIEDCLHIYVDRKSLDYARFITHIRFAVERILDNNTITNELLPIIKEKYKESYDLADDVSKIIEKELAKNVPEDEVAYLAVHIERFKNMK